MHSSLGKEFESHKRQFVDCSSPSFCRTQCALGDHELSSFLIRVLKVEDVGASWTGRVTWHDACHGLRDLNIKSEPRSLIKNVRGAEFVELDNADSCCEIGRAHV